MICLELNISINNLFLLIYLFIVLSMNILMIFIDIFIINFIRVLQSISFSLIEFIRIY